MDKQQTLRAKQKAKQDWDSHAEKPEVKVIRSSDDAANPKTAKTVIIPVIMSGGSGTRLWPASRTATPKQLLPLISKNTMIQETANRFRDAGRTFTFGDPVIICNAAHGEIIKEQLREIGIENPHIIIEPIARNTAPCAAVAALAVHKIDPNALMLLAPADHHIRDTKAFRRTIAHAIPAAHSEHLVTFGITAKSPETGYGYIQKGKSLTLHAHKIAAFREKPDQETAERYIQSQQYHWNAGIFLAKPSALLEQMQQHCPDIKTASQKAFAQASDKNGLTLLDKACFAACPSESFDYAIMEKTDMAAVVEADIGWSDIGSWSTLWEMGKDKNGNALSGDTYVIDTKNTLVQSDGTFVATIGVEDLAIIVKDGAILVTRIDRVQDVKKVVEELKARGDTARL